jgi:hypothetical protein
MKEVLEFEDIVRRAMPRARDEAPLDLVASAIAIMQGRKPLPFGSRKDQLRVIAEQMKAFLPIEKPVLVADDVLTAADVERIRDVMAANDQSDTFVDLRLPLMPDIDDDDDMFDGDADSNEGCSNKGGHVFVEQDTEDGSEGRSYCECCGADGDA